MNVTEVLQRLRDRGDEVAQGSIYKVLSTSTHKVDGVVVKRFERLARGRYHCAQSTTPKVKNGNSRNSHSNEKSARLESELDRLCYQYGSDEVQEALENLRASRGI